MRVLDKYVYCFNDIMSREGTKTTAPPQSVSCCGWGCYVSTPYSYEAQLCLSVNIFSHFNYLMHKNIIFIACMIYIEDIVILHNYNTCTSPFTVYTHAHTLTQI